MRRPMRSRFRLLYQEATACNVEGNSYQGEHRAGGHNTRELHDKLRSRLSYIKY